MYLSEDQMSKRALAIETAQNEGHTLKLRFYKKAKAWYADVPGHLEAQNQMVAGADKMCEALAEGENTATITFATVDVNGAKESAPVRLKRILHDRFGGTYSVHKKGSFIPGVAWLCNVTHTVLGEHPNNIYVLGVTHENVENPDRIHQLGDDPLPIDWVLN